MTLDAVTSQVASSEQLLGPLNEHEQKHAPERLYYAGDAGLLRLPRVSVVGSRDVSDSGLKRTTRLSRELVESGAVVVSGLAFGVDRRAHEAAIKFGGRTIAVLGTPLSEVSPVEHRELQFEIMTNHLAISQFPDGHRVDRTTFPQRNRTMALVSDATVIIEAGERSGTQHQGWEAIRLGRPLFLLRSLVDGEYPTWASKMLDYGAIVLERTEQIWPYIPDEAALSSQARAAF